MTHFVHLAQKILLLNDQNSNAQLTAAICDPSNLQLFLNEISRSNELHFVFTQILMKSILNGEFCPINQTKSDDNCMKENSNQKIKLCAVIIPRVFQNISSGIIRQDYIMKSAIGLISASFKQICDNNKSLPLFVNLLESCLFPSWKVNEYFTSSLNGDLVIIQPASSITSHFVNSNRSLEIYKYSASILIELVDYITMATIYKTYYEYRRNIYTFRNIFLPTILNVATQYHKALHQLWKSNNENDQIIRTLMVSIQLLDKIIAYPFSLTLHEFQADDDNKDCIVSVANADVYYPSTFRNILCDKAFLDMLSELFFFLLRQIADIKQLRQTVYNLVRIFGRIASASVYTFNSEDQRKIFRTYCADVAISLLFNFKFYDFFYLYSLSDIFSKILNTYLTTDLQDRRQKFYEGVMFFCESIIENCCIKLEEGKRNPFARAFQLIVLCVTQTKQTIFQDYINSKAQIILNKAFGKLYNWQQAQKIIEEFGKNQKSQIQCFQELFQHLPVVFTVHLDQNLRKLRALEIEKFSENQKTIWLHLCAVLLPNHLANRQQSEIIVKYFETAQRLDTIASLHYIHVLVNQILHDMENGLPSTCLWSHVGALKKCSFTQFILFILGVCKRNFNQANTQLIDYALQVFKSIYLRLKRHSLTQNPNVEESFDPFYQQVKQLITNLPNTIFENPKFFSRRVQLFSVISTIWINPNNFKYLQEIYQLIASQIKQQLMNYQTKQTNINPIKFMKYMYDLRGILEPIQDYDCFKIICELAIQELEPAMKAVFSTPRQLKILFEQQTFLKAFCKMILQFVTDYGRRLSHHVQNQVSLLIHDLFRPYLIQIAKYQYPKCTVKIWQKFVALNPLQTLLPLIPSFKEKDQKQFSILIKEYFDNIHRVELNELQSLYVYIEDKVQFLSSWWDEVIRRKLYPNVSFYQVIDSRIASNKRQKEQLAKLAFFVGNYHQKYFDLKGCTNEKVFVKWFIENYKDFRQ